MSFRRMDNLCMTVPRNQFPSRDGLYKNSNEGIGTHSGQEIVYRVPMEVHWGARMKRRQAGLWVAGFGCGAGQG